ncbi:energy transducer TonB [Chryseobacterium sp. H1D6B]|uniref:energy transducer TonB n=1 Tax=Chryseobacterium sp. H1D6B TaxID=2940588 RepID=UPI0015CCFE8F|nr:energy transducer TonB [Chryseobacterium sp. H1D6B]
MIKKTALFVILIISGFNKAQVLDEYPKNQDFYEGGMVNFYKEAHDYLINNKFKECDAKEIYQPRILISKDAIVKLVKDNDTANIARNKCAHDLSLEVIKNLKNWKTAEVKGMKIGGITEFIFYPKDIMSSYKENYNAEQLVVYAQYPNGNKAFDKEFHDNFMALFADYGINGTVNLEFYINEKGNIVNPRIYPSIFDRTFNVDFMRTLSRLKKTWKPSLYSNIPIKQRVAFPLNFQITYQER